MMRPVFRLRNGETLYWAGLSVREAHRRAKSDSEAVLELEEGDGWRPCRVERRPYSEGMPPGGAGRTTAYADGLYVVRLVRAHDVDLSDWWPDGPTDETRDVAIDIEQLSLSGLLADLVEVDIEAAELGRALVARAHFLDLERPGWRERTAAMRGN